MQMSFRKNKKMWQIANKKLPIFLFHQTFIPGTFLAGAAPNRPEVGAFFLRQVLHSNNRAWIAFYNFALWPKYALHEFRLLNHRLLSSSSCFLPSSCFCPFDSASHLVLNLNLLDTRLSPSLPGAWTRMCKVYCRVGHCCHPPIFVVSFPFGKKSGLVHTVWH